MASHLYSSPPTDGARLSPYTQHECTPRIPSHTTFPLYGSSFDYQPRSPLDLKHSYYDDIVYHRLYVYTDSDPNATNYQLSTGPLRVPIMEKCYLWFKGCNAKFNNTTPNDSSKPTAWMLHITDDHMDQQKAISSIGSTYQCGLCNALFDRNSTWNTVLSHAQSHVVSGEPRYDDALLRLLKDFGVLTDEDYRSALSHQLRPSRLSRDPDKIVQAQNAPIKLTDLMDGLSLLPAALEDDNCPPSSLRRSLTLPPTSSSIINSGDISFISSAAIDFPKKSLSPPKETEGSSRSGSPGSIGSLSSSYEVIDFDDHNNCVTTCPCEGSGKRRKVAGNSGRSQQNSSGNQGPFRNGGNRSPPGGGGGGDGTGRGGGNNHTGELSLSNEAERHFACPYYKHNQIDYQHTTCATWGDKDQHRVKTHVMRKHLQPKECTRQCGFRAGQGFQIREHEMNACPTNQTYAPLDDDTRRKAEKIENWRGITWKEIYACLFDCDESDAPDPYIYKSVSRPITPNTNPTPPTEAIQIDPIANSKHIEELGIVMWEGIAPLMREVWMKEFPSLYRNCITKMSTGTFGEASTNTSLIVHTEVTPYPGGASSSTNTNPIVQVIPPSEAVSSSITTFDDRYQQLNAANDSEWFDSLIEVEDSYVPGDGNLGCSTGGLFI